MKRIQRIFVQWFPLQRIRKTTTVAIFFSLALLFLSPYLIATSANAQDSANVLLLNSYHPGYRWSDEIIEGIGTTLQESKPTIHLFVEYMDSKRVLSQATSIRLAKLIAEKYRNTVIDALIIADDNAFSFFKQYREIIFPSVPAIFCGANDLQQSDLQGVDNITGINEAADIVTTLETALHLLPKTDHVVVVTDRTHTGQNVNREIRRESRSFNNQVTFSFWDNLSMDQLLTDLRSLKQGTIVLYTFFFTDSDGVFYEYDDSASRIAVASPVPVFGLWEFNLGYGIVGGMLVSGYEHGRAAGEMVLSLISGTPIDSIPLKMKSPNRFAFDFKALTRFNLDTSRLPPNSLVINETVSLYEKHKAMLWSFALAFAAMVILTIFLIVSIGKQRKTEDKLKHSEQRLKEIVDFLPDPTFVIDLEGKVLTWNRAIEEITGITAADILGKGNYEYALPFYGERRPVMIDLVGSWNDQIAAKYRDITKVGEQLISESKEPILGNLHFRIIASPLYDQSGNTAGAIETLHDITQRRKAEEDAENLYNETRTNLAFIKALMSAIPIPVYFKSTDCRFLDCNQAYSDLQGIDDILGKTVFDLYPKDQADYYHKKDLELLQTQGLQRFESEVFDKDMKKREVLFAKSVFHNHTGEVAGIVGTFMDISDLKHARRAQKQLEKQLRQSQKMEALGTLAGGVAHDFNNILSAVLGYSELGMIELNNSRAPLYAKFNAIHQAGERAKDLVAQILAFSKMQEQIKLPIQLVPLIREALKLLKSSLPADIEIKVQVNTEKPVLADATQIHQVLMNLCTNAYHAMQQSGGILGVSMDEIEISEFPQKADLKLEPGPYVRLTISDTGTGIESAIINRIFDPYFTTKKMGKGTGLGLAVVHGIIKQHKGEIVVTSKPGKGTTFHLYLPICDDDSSLVETVPNALQGGAEHVLLIDDEEELIQVGTQMLTTLGYKVTGIVGSNNALELFRENPIQYDIVLSDLDMPGMTGDQLAKEILAIRPEIPILICSGFTDRLNDKQAKVIGIRELLMKPLSMSTLSQTLREVIDNGNPDPVN